MLVKLLNEYAKLPTRGTIDSAGLDVCRLWPLQKRK